VTDAAAAQYGLAFGKPFGAFIGVLGGAAEAAKDHRPEEFQAHVVAQLVD
jgi:hypothetical protein